ncbi:cytochrome P450 [Aspergillus spectabilis]
MYTVPVFSLVAVLRTLYLLLKPLIDYTLDREGLRRYPPYNTLCALTNLGCGIVWGEIAAESAVILDAGSATTAIALNNVIFWLVRNPGCLAKLREEVDEALNAGDTIAPCNKFSKLPYLCACLDESLCITPPFSYNLPHHTPAEGSLIPGEFIPGNTTVSMSSYVAHRDEEPFLDAASYTPEQWFGGKRRDIQSRFVPFSAGSRACIGFSYMEQTVMVATLVRRYEFASSGAGLGAGEG